jgi:membrane protein
MLDLHDPLGSKGDRPMWPVADTRWSARTAAIVKLAIRGFFRDEGLYRASALAFDTVLGLIPCLAFLVSALKGFGAYQALMRDAIRPGIVRMMIAMGAERDQEAVGLLGVFLKVLDLVEQASFGTLGAFGLALLFYIVALLMVSIERSMNFIFGVEKPRTLIRRISDYSAILFIAPLCTILAAGAASGAERLAWVKKGVFLQTTAAAIMCIALCVLYLVMPCRRVRFRSALFGGVAAGIAWYGLLVIHVHFQVGVARYNALYSTFAAIPVFLVWVFVSWIVVLVGAELAAAHDKPELFSWRIRGSEIDHTSRIFIVLRTLGQMALRSLRGQSPATLSILAQDLGMPSEMLRAELERFVERELIVRSLHHGEPRYVIARDLDTIRVGEILDLVERENPAVVRQSELDVRLGEFIDARVTKRDAAMDELSLRQLALLIEPATPAAQQGEKAGQTTPDSTPMGVQ